LMEACDSAFTETVSAAIASRETTESASAAMAATTPVETESSFTLPKSKPIPAEILSEVKATFNEAEVIEVITEIRSGKGRRFEDVIGNLRKAANMPND
jgi:hypothetical protein